MTNRIRRTIGFLGATLMATQLIGAPTAAAVPFQGSSASFEQTMSITPVQKEVERLFKQISSNAEIASQHAERLDSFTRVGSRLHYSTHAAELAGAKDAINAMGADFLSLQELRSGALPWQQLVVDRMELVLVGMAGYATEAIERLNESRGRVLSAEYRDAVTNLNAYTGHASNMIAVNLDYAQAREKLNRLDASALEPITNAPPARESSELSSKASMSLEQRVRTELLKLPYYGVFDHLAFQVNSDQITLSGEVSYPTLKTDAERAVSRVEGVATVSNKIKVLPVSPNDNRLRLATYLAIYGQPTLARYRLNPHPPIRIIVENGHVTLKGVVGSDLDRTIAYMQANSVPGAFSVTNNLQVGS